MEQCLVLLYRSWIRNLSLSLYGPDGVHKKENFTVECTNNLEIFRHRGEGNRPERRNGAPDEGK